MREVLHSIFDLSEQQHAKKKKMDGRTRKKGSGERAGDAGGEK